MQEQTAEFTTSQNRALTFPEEETSTQGLGSPGTEQQILGTGVGGRGELVQSGRTTVMT